MQTNRYQYKCYSANLVFNKEEKKQKETFQKISCKSICDIYINSKGLI